MKLRARTAWLVFALLCTWLHAPLAATQNQTPAAAIGTTNVAVVAWCNKEAGTIEAATFNGAWSLSATTISSGNGNAFHPLVAVDNLSGNAAVVWIETDPATQKYAVYGTFYTNYSTSFPFTGPFHWVSPMQLSISGHDVMPEDLAIAINTAHPASTNVNVIVTWSEYVNGDRGISAIYGIVKTSPASIAPSWTLPSLPGP